MANYKVIALSMTMGKREKPAKSGDIVTDEMLSQVGVNPAEMVKKGFLAKVKKNMDEQIAEKVKAIKEAEEKAIKEAEEKIEESKSKVIGDVEVEDVKIEDAKPEELKSDDEALLESIKPKKKNK